METPVTNDTSRPKRPLSSPAEEQEPKKLVIDDDSQSEGGTDNCSPSQQEATTTLVLQKDSLITIAQLLKESFDKDREEYVTRLIKPVVDAVTAGLHEELAVLKQENNTLKEKNRDLTARIERLELKADEGEKYSRRNCLRVAGVKEEDGEAEITDDIIIQMASSIDVPLTKADIDRSHRVGRRATPGDRRSKPRPIIVKFTSYRARSTLYKARTKLRNGGFQGVFINEDLTKLRNSLLYQARMLVKSNKLAGAWSSDGNILIKEKSGRIQRISSESDLLSLT